ncbi:MAG: sigma-E factor negative regulatory protein [Rhodocyclaceae bacterium]|nr:sigma-E factor negative regulatory protein [Rhodocyclaceae bacterium]MCP5296576.1 sigma-E factor negative regulatory protein [Zoogloeaceae bacterium]PKO72323.1 MAG: anti-sigma 24 factor [Betaproteobacteria bacterium HGW-Betaproteobacteria-14]MBX3677658.1 sigma-E factor negative regulatory protein [Rhodocyclaceae bacterium]MCO5097388.1 sigma-E factor negative regulatory protein [Rhodocyclaceae bacterium]
MKTDISALLDGELEHAETSRAIDALRRDHDLQEAWNTYHLIGDVLRNSPEYSPNIADRVMALLEKEPVQFAPSAQKNRSPLSLAFPLAAAVMGMAAVGWVALSLNAPQKVELAAKAHQASEVAVPVTDKAPSSALKDYLVAHQAHSPHRGIQGVPTYIRTVSEIRQGNRQ